MAELRCIVVTPEATALEQSTEFVALPMYDGELGVASGHSPLIGRLGYGELRLRTGSNVERYYIDGGFVQVADDTVAVLTNRVVPAAELDAAVAREQLEAARGQTANSPDLFEQRDRAVEQARAQARIAERR